MGPYRLLCGIYPLVPVVWLSFSRHADLMATTKSVVFLIPPAILLILAVLFLARGHVCRTRYVPTRIGYDDADSLLTYPQVNNLSVSA